MRALLFLLLLLIFSFFFFFFQAKDTHFIFPSFNLKQKKHGGSKIKILFPPLPGLSPSLATAITLPPQQGQEKGRVQTAPAGEGEGGGVPSSVLISFQI